MRIGYVLRSLEDSGVTVYVLRLAEAMRRRGHDVFLVSDGGTYEGQVRRMELRHHRLALCGNPLVAYLAARRLAGIAAEERPDILHANWRRAQLACHLTEKKLGIPFVSTLHLVGIPDSWLYRRLTHWGRRVIAPCTEAAAYLRRRFRVPDERIELIFHGVDPAGWPEQGVDEKAAARRELGLPAETPVLVCVARLEAIKGHAVLLEAFARAAADYPDLRLLLVGAGAEETRLRRLAAERGIERAVGFLGFTDPHPALAAADVFVLPSWRESFGIAPVEAMLSGRAVVRTDSHGAADQIMPGETGAIVPRGDVSALADALRGVAADRPGWIARGARARERAMEHFTLDIMAGKVEKLYAGVLGSRG